MLTTQWHCRPKLPPWMLLRANCVESSFRSVSTLGAINKGIRASREMQKSKPASTKRPLKFKKEFKSSSSQSRNMSPGSARGHYVASDRSSSERVSRGSVSSGRRREPVWKKPVWKKPAGGDVITRSIDRRASKGQGQTGKFVERSASETVVRPARSNDRKGDNSGRRPDKTTPLGWTVKPNGRERNEDDSALAYSEPYTTAASQFLYGTNTVRAALMSKRRRLYKLHVWKDADEDNATPARNKILAFNGERDEPVPVKHHSDVRILDVMSGGRQHNGLVLDAAPLPVAPVEYLMGGEVGGSIRAALRSQTSEDEEVNRAATAEWRARDDRAPLVLLLDGILDEGNLGGILRSAFLLGVDAVAVCTATCAPLNSGIVAKASSGACEGVRLLAVSRPADFCDSSAEHGWRLWASGPPIKIVNHKKPPIRSTKYKTLPTLKAHEASEGGLKQPTILMIGGEGNGLSEPLKRRSNTMVYIEPMLAPRSSRLGVDSFNVSVATALLIERILRP